MFLALLAHAPMDSSHSLVVAMLYIQGLQGRTLIASPFTHLFAKYSSWEHFVVKETAMQGKALQVR